MSGSGKSTLGAALAEELGLPYQDGDDLHPPANVAKMRDRIPLDDEDRGPWLQRIRIEGVRTCSPADATEGRVEGTVRRGLVISCSALKKAYRCLLRGQEDAGNQRADLIDEEGQIPPHQPFPTRFVYISGRKDVLVERMAKREGHFMKVEMLDSQFAALEVPDPGTEEGIVVVDLEDTTQAQVKKAIAGLLAGFQLSNDRRSIYNS